MGAHWTDGSHPAVVDLRLGPALEVGANRGVVLDEETEDGVLDVATVGERGVRAGAAAADWARVLLALGLGAVGVLVALAEVREEATVLASGGRRFWSPVFVDPVVPRGDGLAEVGLR